MSVRMVLTFGKIKWLLCLSALALTGSASQASGPPTVADALSALGIGLDHVSLIKALDDPRPGVRSFAAGQLAQPEKQQAIPFIEAAWKREQVPQTAINLAAALISLSDPIGSEQLAIYCKAADLGVNLRMQAANALKDAADFRCAPSVLELAASQKTDRGSELVYLSQVPFSERGGENYGPTLADIALNDPDPIDRSLARKALATLGDEPSKARVLMSDPGQVRH